jgi:GT2 family glycosyltransferase
MTDFCSETTLTTSVVTCAFSMERWNDLLSAVASARRQQPSPDEIIIVIDHNPELKVRAETEFPDLRVIHNPNPQGASGARNAGIAAARGALVSFLDDDAVADPSWLAAVRAVCERPGVLGAMGRIEPLWLGPRPAWFPDEFLWVLGCTYRGLPEMVGAVRNLYGSMAFRREVFERIGVFNATVGRTDLQFPWSCEETELCMRARKLIGMGEFMFVPRALVWHRIPTRRLSFRYFCLRCYAEGMSKAYVSALRTSTDTLSAERNYVRGVLTLGILRGFGRTILRFDPRGIARASAITVGLICAIAGFITGKLKLSYLGAQAIKSSSPIDPVAER